MSWVKERHRMPRCAACAGFSKLKPSVPNDNLALRPASQFIFTFFVSNRLNKLELIDDFMNGHAHLSHSFIINAFSPKTASVCRIFNDLTLRADPCAQSTNLEKLL